MLYIYKQLTIVLLVCMWVFFGAVSTFALSIAVHVPEKYADVSPGERFYFEIEVKYPENPQRKDLRLEYEILDGDKVIAQAKVLKAIETQASFMDFVIIPESANKGLHLVNVRVSDYDDLTEEVSTSFHVSSSLDQIKIYFFMLLGTILLVGALLLFELHRVAR